tara:strand:- start:7942 stop:8136 length:195 start_codon:yes stop_codon:yes gene_type:complete
MIDLYGSIFIFVTAIVFTLVGRYFAKQEDIEIVTGIVDNLIKEGYIKTKGTGADQELLKHWEKP